MADVTSDDRGVSTALGYVLNLGVAAVLVTTLLFAAGTLVDDQRDRAVETELRVEGERVAADLAAADRLALASDGGTVRYAVEAPSRVSGTAMMCASTSPATKTARASPRTARAACSSGRP